MDGIRTELESYPEVSFIDHLGFSDFLASVIQDYQNAYREETGKDAVLGKSDPMRMLLYTCAMMIYQGYQYVDHSGKMGLLKYSTGEYLDQLASLKRIRRLEPQPASTTFRFTLSKAQKEVIGIPKGTRARAGDLFFATTLYAEIPVGEETVDVPAVCLSTGSAGNGYLPGEINVLVDPVNYVDRIENLTETAGGTDREDDDALAERVYLAPQGYSVAGPEGAYRFWVRSYSQLVQDCFVTSESPGEVDIYVLLEDGELPGEDFISGLQDFLDDETRRPLTDHVVVKAPQRVEYTIEGTYYISRDRQEMAAVIQKQVEAARDEFIRWQKSAIARDINPSRLIYGLVAAGAKWVDLKSPGFQKMEGASVAVASGVNLAYGGVQDE